MFDYMIVGAGLAGGVLAERLAHSGKKILLVDKRNHIGGNTYDFYNEDGILVHKYGPHIFHTNSSEVFNYLGNFTEWRPYEHRVLASVDGMLVPIPINLNTINKLYGMNLSSCQVESFLESKAEKKQLHGCHNQRRSPVRTSAAIVCKIGTKTVRHKSTASQPGMRGFRSVHEKPCCFCMSKK